MKLKTFLFSLFFFCCSIQINAQIANGSIAPDFTLTDTDGVTHHLYDYLNAGKLVVLDFSATWCLPCWNYHNTGALEDLYNQYGPDGTDQVMVFFIEADIGTDINDLNGTDPASQGDWLSTTVYPIIDLQDNSLANAYQISYYPTIFALCSTDNTVYEAGQEPAATLITWLESCMLDAELDATVDGTCYGESSASISVTGGIAPYTYSWSNGSNDPELIDVGGGIYDVVVTEANGKIVEIENIVVGGPDEELLVTEVVLENALCAGDATGIIDITPGGGNGGYTYQWSNGSTDEDLNNIAAGTYTVSLYDSEGCESIGSFEISEPPVLESEIFTEAELCDNQNGIISFSAVGGTGPYIATAIGDAGVFTSSQGFIENLPAGEYTVIVMDENGCTNEFLEEVEFVEAPEIEVIGDLLLSCSTSSLTLDAFGSGGTSEYEFEWTTSSGNIVSDPQGSSIEIDAPGEYFVVITDLNTGCKNDASAFILSDEDAPLAVAGNDQSIDCNISTVILDATGSTNGANIIYSWTDSDGEIISNEPIVIVSSAGIYILNVLNVENGCQSIDEVAVADESELVIADYESNVADLIVQFTDISQGDAMVWSWDFGDGTMSTDQNPLHAFLASGTYNVCLVATNNCGSETKCDDIEVESAGSALSAFGTSILINCNGMASGAIDLIISGGAPPYTFSWTGENNFTSTEEDLTGLFAGSYQVMITDADNNTIVKDFVITEPDAVVVNGIVNDVLCFGDSNGQISIEIEGGVSPYSISWNVGGNAENLSGLTEGIYNLTVIDANGCESIASYGINEPSELVIDEVNILDQTSIDDLGAISIVVLGGTAPYTYNWSNGATTADIDDLEANLYAVIITDANGCIVSSGDYEVQGFSVGTVDLGLNNSISVMPNPTNNVAQISWDYQLRAEMQLRVANQLGQVVQEIQLGNNAKGVYNLPVNNLPEGMYYLAFSTEDKIAVKKLSVMK